jgi:hypothetical protein
MHFIITSKYDGHYFYKIKTGLNIGYFTIYNKINPELLNHHDIYIRIVTVLNNNNKIILSHDDRIHNDIVCPHYNKIIVGEDRYYLYDPKTIEKFSINIMSKNYIKLAFSKAHFKIFNFIIKMNPPVSFYDKLLDHVSVEGNLDVLEWIKNSGLPLSYSNNAMMSEFVDTDVLNWWKNSGLPLKYDMRHVLINASLWGEIKLLEWWKNSGLQLSYSWNKYERCRLEVIRWWENSNLPVKVDHYYDGFVCQYLGDYKLLKVEYNYILFLKN